VFPARYEMNSYIVFRKRLVSKRLIVIASVVVRRNLTFCKYWGTEGHCGEAVSRLSAFLLLSLYRV
jgi:hypothetical protein